MSLLTDMMEDFYIMNKTKTPDGEGGFATTWTQSQNTFKGAIVNNTSMSARVAEKEGVTSTYTFTTAKSNNIDYHDVIKNSSTGFIYRITSEPKDVQSPTVSTLFIKQATAERWELTT